MEIPQATDLKIERAHRSLATKPAGDALPRSTVVKFVSFKVKEDVLKLARQKRGYTYWERKVFVEHDYGPEVLKKRWEYTDAKRELREKKKIEGLREIEGFL